MFWRKTVAPSLGSFRSWKSKQHVALDTFVSAYKTTLCHIQENHSLSNDCPENRTAYTDYNFQIIIFYWFHHVMFICWDMRKNTGVTSGIIRIYNMFCFQAVWIEWVGPAQSVGWQRSEVRSSDSLQGRDLSLHHCYVLTNSGSTLPSFQWLLWAFSPLLKQLEHEGNHSLPFGS